jgi:hypothetical protein
VTLAAANDDIATELVAAFSSDDRPDNESGDDYQ